MASNLYFDIIANQAQASAALVKLGEAIESVSERLDRLDGKTVNANVNVKTDESRRSLDSLTTRMQLMVAGIVAASPLAGAAIIGGIGAGFIGVAALAQKSNEQVNQTYTSLWQNVVQQTRQATNQLVPQLVGAGRAIDAEFQRLAPTMQAAFTAAGPDIVALTRAVTGFSQGAMPGVTSAMQNSLPVFQGIANFATVMGTAVGSAFTSIGQHAQAYGTFMTTLGGITSTVLGLAVHLVNDLAEVWAANGAQIVQAISGIATVMTSMADGVLPVLSAALGAAAKIVSAITEALGPLLPVLGAVAGGALALWAAFKLAEGAQAAIKALAMGVLNMGASLESGAARTAGLIAGMRGVTVESSAAAVAVRAAGAGAATASVGFAATAASLAGPLSIALAAGIALFAAFSGGEDDAGNSAASLKTSLDGVTSALEASNGAIDESVLKSIQSSEAFKTAVEQAQRFGISQGDIMAAILQGGPAVDKLREKLQHLVDTQHKFVTVAGGSQVDTGELNATGEAAKSTLDALNDLIGGFGKSKDSAAANNAEIQKHASTLATSREGMMAVSRASMALGVDLDAVKSGFMAAALAGGSSASTVEGVAATYLKSALQVANAAAAIQDRFKQADKAVVSAQASVENAQHSYEQSTRAVADAHHQEEQAARAVQQAQQGVADAQHGVITAQRAVRDAIEGVTNAQKAYIQAQDQERNAQQALSEARQQAARDLKAINLQLEEQNASEASARVRLFDAQQSAQGLGIDANNAAKIAGQKVTADNEEQIKAAIDLLQAQNSLNNAMNAGANLREDASKANAAGVNGARGVISAQQSLQSAQDQVASSARGVQKAQEQVADASYGLQQAQRGLQRAHQAVSDAAYAEQKAHQAVTDAQYQSKRAADALKNSKDALKDAQDNASRSLDLNTEAGRRNLGLVLQLWDAINATGLSTQEKHKAVIDQVANAFGMSKDRAADYLKQIGLIPPDFKFGVTAVAALDSVGLWDSIPSPDGHGNAQLTGKYRAYADGGPVYGPGGPRDDMVDAKLSHGEYVHQADAVNYYGVDTMDDINNLRIPKSLIKGYASGGLVDYPTIEANALLGSLGSAYQSSTWGATVMGLPHGPLLPKYVPPPVGFGGVYPSSAGAIGGDALAAQNYARSVLSAFGWGPEQMAPLIALWNGESGWRWNADNPTSSAYGIPQALPGSKMAAAGADWMTNPKTQINWGLGYIKGRRDYGSPAAAYAKWLSRSPHWYADGGLIGKAVRAGAFDNGGEIQPGWTSVYNGTGKPENVRTSAAEDALLTELRSMRSDFVRGLQELSKRPVRGDAYIDGNKIVGYVADSRRQQESADSRGRY